MSVNRHAGGAAASWRFTPDFISLAGFHGRYMLSLSQSGCSTCFKHLYRSSRLSATWALHLPWEIGSMCWLALKEIQQQDPALKNKIDFFFFFFCRLWLNLITCAALLKGAIQAFVAFVGLLFLTQASHHKTTTLGSISKLLLSTRYKSLGGNGPPPPRRRTSVSVVSRHFVEAAASVRLLRHN